MLQEEIAEELLGPEWGFGPLDTVEALHFYNAVGRTGIAYGPAFQMVHRTNIAPDTAAELRWRSAPIYHNVS